MNLVSRYTYIYIYLNSEIVYARACRSVRVQYSTVDFWRRRAIDAVSIHIEAMYTYAAM